MRLIRQFYINAMVSDGLLGLPTFEVATLGVVKPIKAPYTYTPNMLLTDITLSDFDGSTALAQDAIPTFQDDPFSLDTLCWLADPAGGWQWTVSGGTNLPQTVFGYALLNQAGNQLIAVTDPLTTPIPLTAASQGVSVGKLGFRLTGAGFGNADVM